jgi:CheY-like chemotaxis protein
MKKVLVVDNDQLILEFMIDLLSDEGYEVKTAEDGPEALDVLKEYAPDVIFIDMVMPKMSGKELCKAIRGMEALKEASIFYLSSITDVNEMDISGTGANGFIPKGSFDKMSKQILSVVH